MRFKMALIGALCIGSLTSCKVFVTDALVTGPNKPYSVICQPVDIQVFIEPVDFPYTEIGMVEARNGALQEMVDGLKAEASAMGGNAIVDADFSSEYARGTVVIMNDGK